MDVLTWTAAPPPLRDPILVTAFEGLFDVGGAATGAVASLRRGDALELAHIDPDPFFDFTERRPTVRRGPDGHRTVQWPENRVHALPSPTDARDLVVIEGVEPHLRWRTFSEAVTEVAHRTNAALVVTFGAMIAETPHTRPPRVTGSTTDAELAAVMRLDRPTYQGPTGVIGVLHERLERAGIPAVSLRAAVPHYVSGGPNPKASRALLERFERITGLRTGWSDLDDEAAGWERRVDDAMVEDEDVTAYVRRLEERYDRSTATDLPGADDLAAEFERYLRQQDEG